VRAGSRAHRARSQASLAVSADGVSWFLLNVSPDVRAQIEATPELQPTTPRGSPIQGAVLTNGDLDALLGIFCVRESEPLMLHAASPVRQGIVEHNAIYRTLERFDGHTRWRDLRAGERQPLHDREGRPSRLWVEAVRVPGKVPLHLEGRVPEHPDQNIGVLVTDAEHERGLGFFPSVGAWSAELEQAIGRSAWCFFDGTFWRDDELRAQGLGERSARQMAHWPLSGADGSLAFLSRLSHCRRILIHINNTNPILDEGSPERRQLDAAGVEVAYDGMEFSS
jgi:pyrroloquinoline quinone biosynthesis protein B